VTDTHEKIRLLSEEIMEACGGSDASVSIQALLNVCATIIAIKSPTLDVARETVTEVSEKFPDMIGTYWDAAHAH